jgi:hypothetical protein
MRASHEDAKAAKKGSHEDAKRTSHEDAKRTSHEDAKRASHEDAKVAKKNIYLNVIPTRKGGSHLRITPPVGNAQTFVQ